MPWLTGDTIPTVKKCRVISVPDDPVFIQAVNGALLDLAYPKNWEKHGNLTPEEQAGAFDEIYIEFSQSTCRMTAVGVIEMWLEPVPPANYLLCDGGAAFVSEWPELFDLWGYKYGGAGTQFGLPDMADFSPMGQGGVVGLNNTAGALTHALTVNEMPAHTHRVPKQSGTTNAAVNTVSFVTREESLTAPIINTSSQGGSLPHNNLHPVYGVNFIVYAGKQVL